MNIVEVILCVYAFILLLLFLCILFGNAVNFYFWNKQDEREERAKKRVKSMGVVK